MKNSSLVSLFVITGLLFSCADSSLENLPSPSKNKLVTGELGVRIDSLFTPYLEELLSRTDNPAGMAIGIATADSIIYARTFGFANLEEKQEADFNTLFHIASVSKPFTAAAVVKLVEEGKLSLDDRIVSHLPTFKMKGEGADSITVRHMLTHTSGIPRHVNANAWETTNGDTIPMEQNVLDAANFELDFSPGSAYDYSNSAFDILGCVIANVSGMPFEEYVASAILRPCGMEKTTYSKPSSEIPASWAKGYSYGVTTQAWSPFPYAEMYYPSSGIHSTVLDMCSWGMMHLNQGNVGSTAVFAPSSFEILVQPQVETPWGDSLALSWFLQSYLDRPIIMHTGSDTGFESIMYIYPEDNLSIVVMANRDFARTGRIVNALSEIIFEEEPKSYSTSGRYRFAETYREKGIDAAQIEWERLKVDSLDSIYCDDEDVLTAGAVLENGNYFKEAKDVLSYYLTLDSTSTYAWRLHGNAHLHLGDTTQARASYYKTLEINPEYDKGRKALESLQNQ